MRSLALMTLLSIVLLVGGILLGRTKSSPHYIDPNMGLKFLFAGITVLLNGLGILMTTAAWLQSQPESPKRLTGCGIIALVCVILSLPLNLLLFLVGVLRYFAQ